MSALRSTVCVGLHVPYIGPAKPMQLYKCPSDGNLVSHILSVALHNKEVCAPANVLRTSLSVQCVDAVRPDVPYVSAIRLSQHRDGDDAEEGKQGRSRHGIRDDGDDDTQKKSVQQMTPELEQKVAMHAAAPPPKEIMWISLPSCPEKC